MPFKTAVVNMLILFLFSLTASAGNADLQKALKSEYRSAEFVKRDQYRHPKETLEFFDIRPDMTVVEIWPGGGWYTEILAPYLREQGKLYAAHFNPDSSLEYFRKSLQAFREKIAGQPEMYDRVKVTVFDPPEHTEIAPQGSADAVVTFRNVHNWYMRGGGDERVVAAFKAMHKALKPGGILGVVEHRLPASRPLSDQEASGYMREDYIIEKAEEAGFKLVAKSEINANPKDIANYPKGVWTLPPSLRMGEENREHYQSIGESDRMTLKFIKQAAGADDKTARQ